MSTNKPSKRDRTQRIVSLVLVILMIGSVFGSVIYYLALSVSADNKYEGYGPNDFLTALLEKEKQKENEDTDSDDTEAETEADTEVETEADEAETASETADPTEETDAPETSAETVIKPNKETEAETQKAEPQEPISAIPEINSLSDDKLIRVGLMYGTNVTVGFEVTTPYGFTVNKVNRTGDLTNEPLWELDITKLSCTVDHSLSKSGMTYSKTSDPSSAVIGGYHAEIESGMTKEQAEAVIAAVAPTLTANGIYPIPAYVDGGFCIRAGHYATEAQARAVADIISAAHPEYAIGIATPTNTAVSLVDPLTDKILFEYDDRDNTALGLTANDSPEGERAYLVTPAKKLYDGTFMFRRSITDSTDGVSLTDVIPLGEYIKGVLPYEISPSWPLEAQKAFAICVRSYTLAGVRHESTYQTDLCNTVHCQVYNGRARVNDLVEQAVDETEGLVMSYDGAIVTAYYSAVTGGVTVSVEDAWGGKALPYLVAVDTPWENFTTHSEGVWTSEVSGKELCSYLVSRGYSSLRGEITDIRIDELAKNSTYVYKITFTDSYGNTATAKTTDGVRTSLSKYVNSANFVVGKGSVETKKTEFITVAADDLNANTATGVYSVNTEEPLAVITSNGSAVSEIKESYVLTGKRKISLSGSTSVTEDVTLHAENPNNFIFSGTGWGHGVGISQWGVKDLANLGFEATDILTKYFTNIEICDWHDIT